MHHNLTVGTRNRTGKVYKDHFNLALKNQLHQLLHATSNLIPGQDTLPGWNNGWLYEPTTEQIGIAPVPQHLQISADIQPFSES
jgi:long-subunit fatty acid transport protein